MALAQTVIHDSIVDSDVMRQTSCVIGKQYVYASRMTHDV